VLHHRFPLLMIAPEGTTKFGNCLLRFSTGAFVPGLTAAVMLVMQVSGDILAPVLATLG
jgi:hypothetical protein